MEMSAIRNDDKETLHIVIKQRFNTGWTQIHTNIPVDQCTLKCIFNSTAMAHYSFFYIKARNRCPVWKHIDTIGKVFFLTLCQHMQ